MVDKGEGISFFLGAPYIKSYCILLCGVLSLKKVQILTLVLSSIWVPLFQASEKIELTTLWERAWEDKVPSDIPLSVWLEWFDCDSLNKQNKR